MCGQFAPPTREEQFDFFTNTYDDAGEESEQRMSALMAGMKIDSMRRPAPSGGEAADTEEKKVGALYIAYLVHKIIYDITI